MIYQTNNEHKNLHSFPTRRSSDLKQQRSESIIFSSINTRILFNQKLHNLNKSIPTRNQQRRRRSEEHTSELQSHSDIVCRLLLEKKKIYPKVRGRSHCN